jgi:hypothetical protein
MGKYLLRMAMTLIAVGAGIACTWRAVGATHAEAAEARHYVGSQTCQQCHEDQFASFAAHAKKAKSFESVRIMAKGLTAEEIRACYVCHTTGYGQPGGFVSEQETPLLKEAGCEVCHGPGSLHAESGDPADIQRQVSIETCARCHNSERIASFRYKPLLHAGAH